ncbi:Putative PAS/PAC sensor protein [Citrifermentans bremense]|uniref:histidine kinase n=1 Tax=Citrifermentans bremense TaxID=60035 RepID=A0A6S6M1A3_9BACT|nr:PAS domain S-box protein [Citrifermentans bremense]BCG45856.1 Putative PAS/PAC sensor protein [Citrifermentans bremense]
MLKTLKWKRHALLAAVLSLLFWLGDTLVDSFVFGRRSFAEQFLDPEPFEISLRVFYATLAAVFFTFLFILWEKGRKVETALRHSDDLSKIFFGSSRDAICVIETDTLSVSDANSVFLQKYALKDAQSVGSFPELLARNGLTEQVLGQVAACAGGAAPVSFEISYRGGDGGTCYEEVSLHPVGEKQQDVETVLYVARDITVRRRSQKMLEASEARYRAIFENTGTAMAIIEPGGTLQTVNRGFEAVSGFSRSEIEGKRVWTEFLQSPEGAGLDQGTGAERRTFEALLRDRDGMLRSMAGNWAPVEGTQQAVLSLLDISAHKEAEEELRKSRATLAVAQRIARLGNWDWDLCSNALSWSEEMYRIFGMDQTEFTPSYEWFLQTVHPQDLERVVRSINDAIYNSKPYQLDYRIMLPSGAVRTLSASAEVTYDAQGTPLRMVGTNQDITWRIEAEEALKSSEEKFSKAFHASPDSIVITRAVDGTYIDVNEAFQEITGYSRSEVIGKSSTEIGLWADPDARMVMLKLLNEHEHVRNLDVRFRVKSGEVREMLWSADVIEYDGEACLIAISRDVTDQRQMEKELLESDARLYMKHEELKNVFHQMEVIRREWEEIMDCISDMFILADQFGKIRRFNRAVETFTGKAHRDIVGRDCLAFLEEHGLGEHLESPGLELLHKESGKWLVVKRHAFPNAEVDGSSREVVIISDTTGIRRRNGYEAPQAEPELSVVN